MINIIYIRTSTTEQNPENQLADCLSINKYGDYDVLPEEQSAWKDNIKKRPKFEEVCKLIRSNKVKHLIVWDFDRLYRNRIQFKAFLSLLKAHNVQLHSYRQQWIEDLHTIPAPWNEVVYDLMINIYGHIAEEESKKKSDRIKLAVRRKDNITLSYKGNKWGRKNISAQAINKIIELKDIGLTYRQISEKVRYVGKNGQMKNVSLALICKILKNPVYKLLPQNPILKTDTKS